MGTFKEYDDEMRRKLQEKDAEIERLKTPNSIKEKAMTAKLCPMSKGDAFRRVDVDGVEVLTYLNQCVKENCAWWTERKETRDGYEFAQVGHCAVELIAFLMPYK